MGFPALKVTYAKRLPAQARILNVAQMVCRQPACVEVALSQALRKIVIDECSQADRCGGTAQCLNRFGSYLCDCLPGFEADSEGVCQPSELCAGSSACTELGMLCAGTPGEVSCTCEEGKFGNGTFCSDTSNCATNDCENGAECIESQPGFACVCQPGTTGPKCENVVNCALDKVLNEGTSPVIVDPTFRRMLEELAGKEPDEELSVEDLEAITSLNFDSSNLKEGEPAIASLAGIECVSSLSELSITNQNITDISPLLHLERLVAVDLSCNPVADIAALENKSLLTTLFLDWDKNCAESQVALSPLTPIESLLNLRTLHVAQRGISSSTGFDKLVLLQELDVSSNQIDVFTDLGTMPSLQRLYAADTKDTALNDFARFPLLRELELNDTNVTSLAGLQGAEQLRSLYLSNSSLSSLAGIAQSPLLREFSATGNALVSISELASAEGLVSVYLSENSITSVDPLLEVDELLFSGEIYLRSNPIDCPSLSAIESSLNEKNIAVFADCP